MPEPEELVRRRRPLNRGEYVVYGIRAGSGGFDRGFGGGCAAAYILLVKRLDCLGALGDIRILGRRPAGHHEEPAVFVHFDVPASPPMWRESAAADDMYAAAGRRDFRVALESINEIREQSGFALHISVNFVRHAVDIHTEIWAI